MAKANSSIEFARRVVRAISPALYKRINYYRNEGRQERIAQKLIRRYGAMVLNGPFKGMRYVDKSFGSVFCPKLVGSYEEELHAIIERIADAHYDTIVDIGCAEGYYAVGLLLRNPVARGVAFDSEPEARGRCEEMACLNGVSNRLAILGGCDLDGLQTAINGRTLILSDCEGAEIELLDPVKAPALRNCDLLVELHDFLRPRTTQKLQERFGCSHNVQIVDQTGRDATRYQQLQFLTESERRLAVEESRPVRMQWAFFRGRDQQ